MLGSVCLGRKSISFYVSSKYSFAFEPPGKACERHHFGQALDDILLELEAACLHKSISGITELLVVRVVSRWPAWHAEPPTHSHVPSQELFLVVAFDLDLTRSLFA